VVLERLFNLQSTKPPEQRIREAWALDWQNHSDSALLNADYLKDLPKGVSLREWGKAIASFIKSELEGHHVVAVGHSAGSFAMMFSTLECADRLTGMILVESPLIEERLYHKMSNEIEGAYLAMSKVIMSRKSTWNSKQEAYEWYRKRIPWKTWDERIVRRVVEYGLHSTDNGKSVTVKTPPAQEAVSPANTAIPAYESVEIMSKVGLTIPIHLIYGSVVDLMPRYTPDGMVDRSKKAHIASVVEIPDVGHMIIQQNPDAVASRMADIIDTLLMPTQSTATSGSSSASLSAQFTGPAPSVPKNML